MPTSKTPAVTPRERLRDYQDRTAPAAEKPPKVLSNRPNGRGVVYVEWSLPRLRRALLAVPEHRWIEGGHVAVGRHLAGFLEELDLQAAAIGSRVPGG